MYSTYQSLSIFLFLFFSGPELVTPSKDELFYVTPTQPPNPECPQNSPCQTLQYYFDNSTVLRDFDSNTKLTLMFLNGNHTLTLCLCTRLVILPAKLAIVGLKGSVVVIHNMEVDFQVFQLTIDNIVLHNGEILISEPYYYWISLSPGIDISLHAVKLIECSLFVPSLASGDLVELQTYNSQLSLASSSNVTFTNCSFHGFNGGLYPSLTRNPIKTTITIDESDVMFAGISRFYNNHHSALVSYSSVITLMGSVSFVNNTSIRGGAIALYSSTLNLEAGTNVTFINNSAQETGGAIHIEPDLTRMLKLECFYRVKHCYATINRIKLYFATNSAKNGGDNVYGTSLNYCSHYCINITALDIRKSSVSSDPLHICICDSKGQPQCTNTSFINMSKTVHPGETFTLPAVIVGLDYGMTIGTVYANFLPSDESNSSSIAAPESVPNLEPKYQYSQLINNISCTKLIYSIYSEHMQRNFILYLTVQYTRNPRNLIKQNFWKYCTPSSRHKSNCRHSPIFINVTILPCPPGFTLLKSPSRCGCNPVLTNNGVQCVITNGTGYFVWDNDLWISVNEKGVIYTKNCPLNHCIAASKTIDLIKTPNAQCAFNRAGRLCGSCKKGYSLAVGSSSCIRCSNNNNLALLLFFIVAGFLLVLFINILNLTITQGLTNGLIFYANIVWTSQSILFPMHDVSNVAIVFLRTFLAWINLDFGIETCFVDGLTALVKTWLQFLFPLYIWAIAGLMILTAKYSNTLTRIYGNKSVPVLATLFLLSYMKLLRTIVTIFLFTHLSEYPKGSTLVVWSVDGELDYFGVTHAFLLVAALAVVVFLWLPYTLSLLFLQQLQKISNSCRLLMWINKLGPFYDAHFAPFKAKHRYWFGLLLLTRGILLVLFASTVTVHQSIYLLIVFVFGIALLLYVAIMHPFESTIVLVIESSSLANLTLLSGFLLYAQTQAGYVVTLQITAAGISAGIIFIQFCGIILYNVIKARRCICSNRHASNVRSYINDNQEEYNMDEVDDEFLADYRDSQVMESLATK